MKRMLLDDTARNAILGQMREGVIVAGRDGELLFVNEAASEVHGASVLGTMPEDYAREYNLFAVDGSPLAPEEMPLTRAVRYGETTENFRWRVRHPDGHEVLAIGSAKPVYDCNGVQLGAVLTLRDDTERYALEQRLIEINRDLEARVKAAADEAVRVEGELHQMQRLDAIGRLTGGVAHEINNVLTIVMACLEEVQANCPASPAITAVIEDALNASERGARLPKQLLSYARRQPLEPRAVNLDAILEDVPRLIAPLGRPDITLEIPLSGVEGRPFADPNQLEDAVVNLVLNAIDAMPYGGHLSLSTELLTLQEPQDDLKPGSYVALTVRDTGVGMERDVLARATEPFFTTRGAGNARGLGLSVVDGFARQSGGTLLLRSEPDEGTEARLILPLDRRQSAIKSVASAGSGAEQLHVLLVEDDPQVLRSATRRIERMGYRVTAAGSADGALACLKTTPGIDIVFSDVMMRGRPDGLRLAEATRTTFPSLPILLTSGHIGVVDGKPLPAGVRFLPKPYRNHELQRALRNAFEG
ncbi:ATP-binding protein [Sphingomonas sp. IW22]|uniref:hybrid sensor histidine kinase/response regulator n=1 Tax=Sphingomonas sp. IW22 TaxID=3242489 RepID=UPI003520B7E9